jgi:hypothetical protein
MANKDGFRLLIFLLLNREQCPLLFTKVILLNL